MLGNLFIAVILLVIGVLNGWAVPLAVKSERPYGLVGDVLASVLSMLAWGLAAWIFVLPALNFTGWLAILAAIGDSWGLALVVLWLMRRVKR
jgi:hypothetical protein